MSRLYIAIMRYYGRINTQVPHEQMPEACQSGSGALLVVMALSYLHEGTVLAADAEAVFASGNHRCPASSSGNHALTPLHHEIIPHVLHTAALSLVLCTHADIGRCIT